MIPTSVCQRNAIDAIEEMCGVWKVEIEVRYCGPAAQGKNGTEQRTRDKDIIKGIQTSTPKSFIEEVVEREERKVGTLADRKLIFRCVETESCRTFSVYKKFRHKSVES